MLLLPPGLPGTATVPVLLQKVLDTHVPTPRPGTRERGCCSAAAWPDLPPVHGFTAPGHP